MWVHNCSYCGGRAGGTAGNKEAAEEALSGPGIDEWPSCSWQGGSTVCETKEGCDPGPGTVVGMQLSTKYGLVQWTQLSLTHL